MVGPFLQSLGFAVDGVARGSIGTATVAKGQGAFDAPSGVKAAIDGVF